MRKAVNDLDRALTEALSALDVFEEQWEEAKKHGITPTIEDWYVRRFAVLRSQIMQDRSELRKHAVETELNDLDSLTEEPVTLLDRDNLSTALKYGAD